MKELKALFINNLIPIIKNSHYGSVAGILRDSMLIFKFANKQKPVRISLSSHVGVSGEDKQELFLCVSPELGSPSFSGSFNLSQAILSLKYSCAEGVATE